MIGRHGPTYEGLIGMTGRIDTVHKVTPCVRQAVNAIKHFASVSPTLQTTLDALAL